MECPKCGAATDEDAAECLRCGIIFSRYDEARQRPRTAEPTEAKAWTLSNTSRRSLKSTRFWVNVLGGLQVLATLALFLLGVLLYAAAPSGQEPFPQILLFLLYAFLSGLTARYLIGCHRAIGSVLEARTADPSRGFDGVFMGFERFFRFTGMISLVALLAVAGVILVGIGMESLRGF